MSLFQVECCGKLHKARVYKLVSENGYKNSYLKIAYCPVCKTTFAITEKVSIKNNKKKRERYNGYFAAARIYKHLLYAIITEICSFKCGASSSFYLKYNEYGKIKKCYSNLSALKLGLIKSNFEDLEAGKRLLS